MNPVSVINHLKIEPAQEGECNWDKNILTFTPDQSWPSGQEIIVHLESGARAASWMTFPMEVKDWSFTTGEAYLAFR
jgi:hypothetical protein